MKQEAAIFRRLLFPNIIGIVALKMDPSSAVRDAAENTTLAVWPAAVAASGAV